MAMCKFCDVQIIWGEIGDKKIPLDVNTPVYVKDPKAEAPGIVRTGTAWVDHRIVCSPKAAPLPDRDYSEPKGASDV